MVIKQRKCSGIKKRDNSRDKTKEHKHMNRKFYFKNILWGMCPIIISILHLIYDTPTEASIKVDLFLILSGLALPCSIYLTKTITLKYTSISFWKKPLFWSYGI
ncbi:colicin immunity protein, partial [Escherichia coli]